MRVHLRKAISLVVVMSSCCQSTPAELDSARVIIHRLVRDAASHDLMVGKIELGSRDMRPEVMDWLSRNQESLEGTQSGPFDPTEQYVSFYSENRIYVHVLDRAGRNNVLLPAVIDRPVQKAWLLRGPTVRVDQAPWGMQLVLPEEQQPDAIDTIVVLEFSQSAADLAQPRVVEGEPAGFILLQGDNAQVRGGLRHNPGPDWLEGWTNVKASATWRVRVPAPGEYILAITYSCARGHGGAEFQITTQDGRVTGTTQETAGLFGGWQNFEKRDLEGSLHLAQGVNTITLRATQSNGGEILRLYGLYLYSREAKAALAANALRADKVRSSTDWFRAAKYGLMVHWAASTSPRAGKAPPFCEAVQDFNVSRFVDMVESTGAGYLIFTLAHGIQKFPGPFRAVDAVAPGRTCSRDLPGELASALGGKGIKLILYYHHGVGDAGWAQASGFLQSDKSPFFAHEAAILEEAGLRYGTNLAGWWFDDRYPFQPFEELYQATKAGNPNRIVAWNSWILPKSTAFQEYWAGEVGGALLRLPEEGYFDHDGPQSRLQPHVLLFIDDPWMHTQLNTEIHGPLFGDKELADYILDCNRKGAPVTVNIGVYLDGTASPATLAQLERIKQIIRGNRGH